MEKPRRVITIHLPHRETVAAALLIFLLGAVSFLGMISPFVFPPAPPEEEAPQEITIPNAQLVDAAP